ncbi:MAG: ribonuclease Z [Candidatus Omnitrophota bacterium]
MSKITITMLGTSAGMPTKERSHPAVYFDHNDEEKFCCLFDCGEGTQRQLSLADINIMKIDHIFITHWHGDHFFGLPGILDTMGFEGRTKPLNIYAPEPGMVKKISGLSRSLRKIKIKVHAVSSRGRNVKRLVKTERFDIVSVPVKHSRPAVAYAFLEKDKVSIDLEKAQAWGLPGKGEIYRKLKKKGKLFLDGKKVLLEDVSATKKGKKIVYSGDTEMCNNLKRFVSVADLLVQDCTYFNEDVSEKIYRHASLDEIGKMALAQKVKRVILTHISGRYHDPDYLKTLAGKYPKFEIAYDFMKIVL